MLFWIAISLGNSLKVFLLPNFYFFGTFCPCIYASIRCFLHLNNLVRMTRAAEINAEPIESAHEEHANSAIDSRLHAEWHPKDRRGRFPGIEERVKLYMSNWYLPPCHGRISFGTEESTSNSSNFTALRHQEEEIPALLSDKPIRDAPFYLQKDPIIACAEGTESSELSSFCMDIVTDLGVFDLRPSTPVIAIVGDRLPDVLLSQHSVQYIPILSKYRGTSSKKDILQASIGGTSNGESCIEKRNRLRYTTQYREELDQNLGIYPEKNLPFAPIIWKLNTKRHYGGALDTVRNNDIYWTNKVPKAVWRGGISRVGLKRVLKRGKLQPQESCHKIPRCLFVMRHHNSSGIVDASFALAEANEMDTWIHESGLSQHQLSIEELLKYKILISLEGNDVSSGLKWMLLSNSVVLMPPPSRTSWAMEELLEPYVHYVPMANDDKAQRIAERATLFMEDLLFHPDAEADELQIKREIMRRYRAHWEKE